MVSASVSPTVNTISADFDFSISSAAVGASLPTSNTHSETALPDVSSCRYASSVRSFGIVSSKVSYTVIDTLYLPTFSVV